MILRVKKPDYLGESMWEFRWGNRNFLAKVSHLDWLARFQSREIMIRPGDSIRAIVRISDRYDFSGELTGTTSDVIEVKDVINLPEQEQLYF